MESQDDGTSAISAFIFMGIVGVLASIVVPKIGSYFTKNYEVKDNGSFKWKGEK